MGEISGMLWSILKRATAEVVELPNDLASRSAASIS